MNTTHCLTLTICLVLASACGPAGYDDNPYDETGTETGSREDDHEPECNPFAFNFCTIAEGDAWFSACMAECPHVNTHTAGEYDLCPVTACHQGCLADAALRDAKCYAKWESCDPEPVVQVHALACQAQAHVRANACMSQCTTADGGPEYARCQAQLVDELAQC